MTREQFLDFIQHPENVGAAESIASLTGQFPYCQPLRYLYLKQLAVSDSVQYPQQLKITAAMAPDRTRLFRLIHPEPDGPDHATAASEVFVSTSALTTDSTNDDAALAYVSATEVHAGVVHTEYEAPAEESKMSVEEIVNQRLRELNLWQEPETSSTEAPQAEVQHLTAVPDETTSEEKTVEPVWTPQPEYHLPEEPLAEEETLQTANPESETEATTSVEAITPEPEASAIDPLDEIIQEGLIETRLRNSEYFSDQLLEEIAAAPIAEASSATGSAVTDELSEKKLEESPAPVTNGLEPYTTHTRESHSFTEWLKLNHTAEEKKKEEEESALPTSVENIKDESEIQISETAAPAVESALQLAVPAATSAVESTTVPEEKNITASLSENQQAEQPRHQPVANVRFIFVKSANTEAAYDEPAHVVIHETPAPVYAAPIIAEPVKAPVTTPIAAVPPSAELPEAEETLFTGDIIPPKKPIPDPALVDTDPPKPKVPASELIEKFIREEPRITPSKSTFYSPSNMAKKSIVEPEDLITETLANIYAQQGNFKKAISFYQKLSLKFPEKSRYFAALIEELKKKSNS